MFQRSKYRFPCLKRQYFNKLVYFVVAYEPLCYTSELMNWILREFSHHGYGRWIYSSSSVVFNLDKMFAESTGRKINKYPMPSPGTCYLMKCEQWVRIKSYLSKHKSEPQIFKEQMIFSAWHTAYQGVKVYSNQSAVIIGTV